MTPRIFGQAIQSSSPIESEELCSLLIAAHPADLRLLAHFLNDCADDIEMNGITFTHRTLKDEPAYQQSNARLPEIKVSRCV